MARRPTPQWADPSDVERVARDWTDAQVECRTLGHHWAAMDAVHVARLRYYRVSHICERCQIVRTREMSESGAVYAQNYQYPDGYLVKGLGRIAGDARDVLRVVAIQRTPVREIRGKAKESDMPRFGATRHAIGD